MKNHYIKNILIPPRIIKDFASIRKMIKKVLENQPKHVTFEEAKRQVEKI